MTLRIHITPTNLAFSFLSLLRKKYLTLVGQNYKAVPRYDASETFNGTSIRLYQPSDRR